MIESPDVQNRTTQSTFLKRKFPLISTVQKMHEHNLHVAHVCRQNSLHSSSSFEKTKSHFMKDGLKKHEDHILNALSLSQEKKKHLEERRSNAEKRSSQNILKCQRYLDKKRVGVVDKEKNRMEKSLIRRQEFMKSLNNSVHRSTDKLHHIHERSKNQMNNSSTLFFISQVKEEAAIERKQAFTIQLQEVLRERNNQIDQIQKFWNKKSEEKEKDYIQQLASKLEKAQRNSEENNDKVAKWLTEKRKSQQKVKEQYLKKRSILQENKEEKREQENKKSQQKIEKAVKAKKMMLSTITNTLDQKRKEKQLSRNSSILSMKKQEEERVKYLNEKHKFSSEILQAYKQEMQRIHNKNLTQICLATYSK